MSVMITIHFFWAIDNLKGYFEEHDDKNNVVGKTKNYKYLTIIFTSEYKKLMYTEILKKINKDINKNYVKVKFESNDNVSLNILVNIHTLVLVVRYQRIYINTCCYYEFYEKVRVLNN